MDPRLLLGSEGPAGVDGRLRPSHPSGAKRDPPRDRGEQTVSQRERGMVFGSP